MSLPVSRTLLTLISVNVKDTKLQVSLYHTVNSTQMVQIINFWNGGFFFFFVEINSFIIISKPKIL
jgi:hypothetical protein